MSDTKSDLLLQATIELLRESEDPYAITTRSIAEKAGVNLALINYYYGSKDGLMKAAVGEIVGVSSKDLYGYIDDTDPRNQIVGFFVSIMKDMLRFRRIAVTFLSDSILKDGIGLPEYILPAVRKHFSGKKDESGCRMVAYRMVVQLQAIFLRLDDVGRYVGKDLCNEDVLGRLIEDVVDSTLGEGYR